MFRSRTGWLAVVVSIIGALTAVDVLPLVSAFLTETIGAKAAHGIGAALSLMGVVIAKLSNPTAEPKAE